MQVSPQYSMKVCREMWREHTVESFATAGGGTFSNTLNVFWSTIWAAAGTLCAKAEPTAALMARNALAEGILSRESN